MLSQLEVKIF